LQVAVAEAVIISRPLLLLLQLPLLLFE